MRLWGSKGGRNGRAGRQGIHGGGKGWWRVSSVSRRDGKTLGRKGEWARRGWVAMGAGREAGRAGSASEWESVHMLGTWLGAGCGGWQRLLLLASVQQARQGPVSYACGVVVLQLLLCSAVATSCDIDALSTCCGTLTHHMPAHRSRCLVVSSKTTTHKASVPLCAHCCHCKPLASLLHTHAFTQVLLLLSLSCTYNPFVPCRQQSPARRHDGAAVAHAQRP